MLFRISDQKVRRRVYSTIFLFLFIFSLASSNSRIDTSDLPLKNNRQDSENSYEIIDLMNGNNEFINSDIQDSGHIDSGST